MENINISAYHMQRIADEYNQNNESYKKELYNVIRVINEKITTEAEQGKYQYEDHLTDTNKLGKKFDKLIYDLMKYYESRNFTAEFNKQLDCSYKYTISWKNIPDNKNITKEQNLDVDQYEYNDIDKTYDYLENFFKDRNVSFSRSTDENKFEYITASFLYYHHRLRIDCCDDTKYYCIKDTWDDVHIGDFNSLIKLINIIEAYICD